MIFNSMSSIVSFGFKFIHEFERPHFQNEKVEICTYRRIQKSMANDVIFFLQCWVCRILGFCSWPEHVLSQMQTRCWGVSRGRNIDRRQTATNCQNNSHHSTEPSHNPPWWSRSYWCKASISKVKSSMRFIAWRT